MLFSKYRRKVAEKNLSKNRQNREPDEMINGQNEFTAYSFGLSTLDKVGCGIIAIYNVLRLLGRTVQFSDLIYEFELNCTETIPFGFFGINPFLMKKYFDAHQISYSEIHRMNTLESLKEEGGIYLLTFWNDARKWTKGAHTVALSYTGGKYVVYNRTNSGKGTMEFVNTHDIVGNGLLIRGYRLYKGNEDEVGIR